jgi:hypothetical protein
MVPAAVAVYDAAQEQAEIISELKPNWFRFTF